MPDFYALSPHSSAPVITSPPNACSIGDVCDEQTKRCIPKELAFTPDVYDDTCACSLPGKTSDNPAKPFLVLALLALLRRRKLHS